jgi:hypothetical protein
MEPPSAGGVYESTDEEARMIVSEYDAVDIICLGLAGALLLRGLVRMERFHCARVVILTLVLWVPVVYLFMLSWPGVIEHDCAPAEGAACFRYSEM